VKIIIVNHRYFLSGGPERYLFNLKKLLETKGHQVIPFSIKHNRNKYSEYSDYFLDPVGTGDEVYFESYRKNNIRDLIKLIGRLYYSFEARRKLSKLIINVKPDIVYLLLYQNKISPSIIHAAKKSGIPVVVRVSDYSMICAANVFYLHRKNEICERCLTSGQHHGVINKCAHNSYLYSFMKYSSYKLHQYLKIYDYVSAYIIPSAFTASRFQQHGIMMNKIFNIPTFAETGNMVEPSYERFALYIGRIEPEKGISTMIDAFLGTGVPLIIAGFSQNGYDIQLKSRIQENDHKITFAGKLESEEISVLLQKCAFTICPSECYDNFPNSVLESYAHKKAVLATNLGSLKEMVIDGETGFLFEPKNSADLKAKVLELIDNREKLERFGNNGYSRLAVEYSSENHYEKLLGAFKSVISTAHS